MELKPAKITTQSVYGGYFTALINGYPLVGRKGHASRFPTRKQAIEAAKERLNGLYDKDKQEMGISLEQ